ncbi:MAG: hypothetical protein IKG40_02915 [Bacilli bacterium]|nr:hypothetical protein [Bacilli bacterium]
MDEMIKQVINNVKGEISIVDEVDGLCYYASNNIIYDLSKNDIKADMYNISELADVDYNHYFVLIKDYNYLVDVTYFQFVKNDSKLRFFKKWPGEILEKNNNGLLQKLINDGYAKIDNKDLYNYLESFNEAFAAIFTLEDLKEIYI